MIKETNRVNVYFDHVEAEFNVKVMYKPQQLGDVWIVQRDDGTEVTIQTFAKMEKLS